MVYTKYVYIYIYIFSLYLYLDIYIRSSWALHKFADQETHLGGTACPRMAVRCIFLNPGILNSGKRSTIIREIRRNYRGSQVQMQRHLVIKHGNETYPC